MPLYIYSLFFLCPCIETWADPWLAILGSHPGSHFSNQKVSSQALASPVTCESGPLRLICILTFHDKYSLCHMVAFLLASKFAWVSRAQVNFIPQKFSMAVNFLLSQIQILNLAFKILHDLTRAHSFNFICHRLHAICVATKLLTVPWTCLYSCCSILFVPPSGPTPSLRLTRCLHSEAFATSPVGITK